MNLGIENKIALIIGSDSGIGLATAKTLAAEGCTLILSSRSEEKLKLAKQEILKVNDQAAVYYHVCDIIKNAEVADLAEYTDRNFGGVDIVVNSAGARGAAGDFLELTDDDWHETIDVDLMGAVRICRAFIPQLKKKGWGRIVLIASENAYQPYEEESAYNACKAAIINLSKCLSRSYGKDGILVNSVSPAYIETPMTDAMMEELAKEKNISVEEAVEWFLKNKRPHIEVQRRGQPDEVAAVITFLCSEKASFVNGSNYRVDAGSVESAFS